MISRLALFKFNSNFQQAKYGSFVEICNQPVIDIINDSNHKQNTEQ